VGAVADFMHAQLNPRVSSAAWARAMFTPWASGAPNRGFLLRAEGKVVGAYLAYYSRRVVRGQEIDVCNLGAWCVLDDHRASGFRLLRALLAQPGYHFTDLSPSGNVIALNERLGFSRLDTTTWLVPNLPRPSPRGVRVTCDPDTVSSRISPDARELYIDHRATAAARHLLVEADGRPCYVIFRHDRRKGLPMFASILYASDPDLCRSHIGAVATHLLVRHGVAATLCEARVVGGRPVGSLAVPHPRPKMFLSDLLGPDDVDYLYSELECLEW
jgi:hypothetical protein